MVVKKKKTYTTISIFIPEEDFDLPKEVNKMAKADPKIAKDNLKSKKNLVSYITRLLWKGYVSSQKRNKNETNTIESQEED